MCRLKERVLLSSPVPPTLRRVRLRLSVRRAARAARGYSAAAAVLPVARADQTEAAEHSEVWAAMSADSEAS